MYISNNGKFKEGIIFWDTDIDKNVDVDIYFYIHDYDGRAEFKYGFKTLTIDLEQSKEEIFSKYQSKLRQEIRQAQSVGYKIVRTTNPTTEQVKEFVKNFNSFAEYKKLSKISEELLIDMANENKIVISLIYLNETLIVGHTHYCAQGKARQYHQFSMSNNLSQKENSLANKILVHDDIMYFKDNEFKVYDFGGIGNVDGDNSRFQGIIDFKKKFGGDEKIIWKGVTPNGARGKEVVEKYFSQIVFKK